jgi:hypothetical protein
VSDGFKRLFTDPDRQWEALLLFLVLLMIVVLLIWGPPVHADEVLAPAEPSGAALTEPPEPPEAPVGGPVVASYIRRFVAGNCDGAKRDRDRRICMTWASRDARWKAADTLGDQIAQAAGRHDLDPLLVAVAVRAESSFWSHDPKAPKPKGKWQRKHWRPAPLAGAKEEVGLLQVRGLALSRAEAAGYDLTTPEGQLDAGCLELRRCQDACGGSPAATYAGYIYGDCARGQAPKASWRARLLEAARAWARTLGSLLPTVS